MSARNGIAFVIALVALSPFSATAATSSATSSAPTITALQSLVAQLESEFAALAAAKGANTAPVSEPTPAHITFTRLLSLGSKGSDVSALQQILKNADFYTYSEITGYFGPLTEKALAAYQTAHGLDAVGYTGPKTRALLNGVAESSGSGSATEPTGSPATASATSSSSAVPPLFPVTPGYGGGGGSVSGGGSASPAPDTTPPTISAITATSIASSTEIITWTTSKAATSVVNFGLTTSYGSASSSASLVTSQSITLTGLTASTTYDFEVSSEDTNGNTATSSNQTFTTAAYNYYVDSVNGNDSNPGTSPALAFKDITALPTIAAGQSICLVAGSYWRQFLNLGSGSPLPNLTITGCGTGAQPTIDASDLISTSTWSKTAGLTNTYNTGSLTAPASYNIGTPWIEAFENGTYLAYETSTSTVDSTPGSFTVSSMTSPTVTLYVHASDGSNPATNSKTYEYTSRPAALYLYAGVNDYVSNINFKRDGATSGAIQAIGDGSNPTFNDVTCTQGGRHCIQMPAGTIENSTFSNVYDPSADGTASELVIFEGVGSGNPTTVLNDTFNRGSTVTAADAATENTPEAIGWHTGSGSLGALIITGGSVTDQAPAVVGFGGFGGSNNTSWSDASTTFYDISPAISPNASQAITISGVKEKTLATSTPAAYPYFALLNGGSSLTVNNSNFCFANLNYGVFEKTSGNSTTLSTSGNSFYALATQGRSASWVADFGGNLTFSSNNNMIDLTQHSGLPAYNGNASGETYTGNNNSFPGASQWVLNNTTYNNLAGWQAATTQDGNSTTTGSGASACN